MNGPKPTIITSNVNVTATVDLEVTGTPEDVINVLKVINEGTIDFAELEEKVGGNIATLVWELVKSKYEGFDVVAHPTELKAEIGLKE